MLKTSKEIYYLEYKEVDIECHCSFYGGEIDNTEFFIEGQDVTELMDAAIIDVYVLNNKPAVTTMHEELTELCQQEYNKSQYVH